MKQQSTTIVPQAYANGMRLVIGAMFFVTLQGPPSAVDGLSLISQ